MSQTIWTKKKGLEIVINTDPPVDWQAFVQLDHVAETSSVFCH